MHPVFKFKKYCLYFIITILITCLSGCKQTIHQDFITVRDWFTLISDNLNIKDNQNVQEQFLSLKHDEAYDIVVALNNWGVIEDIDTFKLDDYLTRDYYCITIKRLIIDNYEPCKVVQNESDYVEEQEATNAIAFIKEKLNHKVFEDHFEIDYKTDVIEIEGIVKDEKIITDKAVSQGDVIQYQSNDGYVLKEVVDVIEKEEYYELQLKDVVLEDVLKSMKLSGSFVLNLEDTDIIDLHDVKETLNIQDLVEKNYISTQVNKGKEFVYKDFKVSYSIHKNKIHVYVSKKVNGNYNLFGELDVYDIQPNYEYKNLQNAYFRLDFKTLSSFGLNRSNYIDVYKHLHKDVSQFFTTITKSFQKDKEITDITIPILKLKVSLPNAPIADMYLTLNLHIYASGRVELTFDTNNRYGFEIKDGHFRFLNDFDGDLDFVLKASFNGYVGLQAALRVLGQPIMDIGLKAGIKGLIKSTIHIFDTNNQVSSEPSDLPMDYLDELSKKYSNIQICGDLSLHWLLNITVNSQNTLLGRFNLGKTFELLDDKHQIFKNKYTHLENWLFVPKCTVEHKTSFKPLEVPLLNANKILVDRYNYLIVKNKNVRIHIKGLPSNYQVNDLLFESKDRKVADVDEKGLITGINKGSTMITIKTKDQKYHTALSVLVQDEVSTSH